jgi:hypothetical protein
MVGEISGPDDGDSVGAADVWASAPAAPAIHNSAAAPTRSPDLIVIRIP